MTREGIIDGLKFTVEMFLFNPSTGEKITEPRNDMDKTTIDACRGAIELLKQEPCEDAISRQAVLDLAEKGILVGNHNYKSVCNAINDLPSVTPIEHAWDNRLIKIIREQDCLIINLFNYAAENGYKDIYTMIDKFLFADRKDLKEDEIEC